MAGTQLARSWYASPGFVELVKKLSHLLDLIVLCVISVASGERESYSRQQRVLKVEVPSFRRSFLEPCSSQLSLELTNLGRHASTPTLHALRTQERLDDPLEGRLDDVEDRLRIDAEEDRQENEWDEGQAFLDGDVGHRNRAVVIVRGVVCV